MLCDYCQAFTGNQVVAVMSGEYLVIVLACIDIAGFQHAPVTKGEVPARALLTL